MHVKFYHETQQIPRTRQHKNETHWLLQSIYWWISRKSFSISSKSGTKLFLSIIITTFFSLFHHLDFTTFIFYFLSSETQISNISVSQPKKINQNEQIQPLYLSQKHIIRSQHSLDFSNENVERIKTKRKRVSSISPPYHLKDQNQGIKVTNSIQEVRHI